MWHKLIYLSKHHKEKSNSVLDHVTKREGTETGEFRERERGRPSKPVKYMDQTGRLVTVLPACCNIQKKLMVSQMSLEL